MKFGRIGRGVARMALMWGIAWIPLQFTLMTIFGAFTSARLSGISIVAIVLQAFLGGALNGAVFALVLSRIGRRQTIRTLTLGRIAIAGAIGGAAFTALSYTIAAFASITLTPLQVAIGMGMSSVVGSVCAAGNLVLARRAPQLAEPNDAISLSAPGSSAA